ncbi:hypothetical protein ABL78_2779 [Leptomonas seymouri]|uniref:Uncharacterized protein n=1 Tax=Leptomonas seymouri TaxID=5684 RepID=A0A0N0P6X7_LEPSE|nr:hypothetical protein ABL78_2779 [Leptomonas seymouri]|eukprot:KPI88146.1 hypothetical protein ABL78_2779 [Leptomonas seymouri]
MLPTPQCGKGLSTLSRAYASAYARACSSRRDAKRVLPRFPPPSLPSPGSAVRLLQDVLTHHRRLKSVGTLLASRQCLHTTTCNLARSSPPDRRPSSRASTAADDLLSRWSRRSPTSTSAAREPSAPEAATNASTAKPAVEQQGDLSSDSLNVEELLLFDEDDRVESSMVTQAAKQPMNRDGNATNRQARDAVAASPGSSVTVRSGACEDFAASSAASSALQGGEMDEDDADVYGIAASTAALGGHLMEDLLQQASLDSMSEAASALEDAETMRTPFSSPRNTSSAENSELPPQQAASSAREIDVDPSATAAFSAEGSEAKGVHASVHNRQSSLVTATLSEAVDAHPSESDVTEDETQLEAEDGEEDESMDIVLEEETDRMLQAALANMMKESSAATSGANRPQMGGSGGYVFFSQEAVMAAAESLSASTPVPADEVCAGSASATASTERRGSAAAVETSGVEADFDDDAVREAEMESLGLNMGTPKS